MAINYLKHSLCVLARQSYCYTHGSEWAGTDADRGWGLPGESWHPRGRLLLGYQAFPMLGLPCGPLRSLETPDTGLPLGRATKGNRALWWTQRFLSLQTCLAPPSHPLAPPTGTHTYTPTYQATCWLQPHPVYLSAKLPFPPARSGAQGTPLAFRRRSPDGMGGMREGGSSRDHSFPSQVQLASWLWEQGPGLCSKEMLRAPEGPPAPGPRVSNHRCAGRL